MSVLGLWLLFLTVWVISSVGAKKSVRNRAWSRGVGLRLIVVALILFSLRVPSVSHGFHHARLYLANRNPNLGAGVGSNWGLPMSRKANPELIPDSCSR